MLGGLDFSLHEIFLETVEQKQA